MEATYLSETSANFQWTVPIFIPTTVRTSNVKHGDVHDDKIKGLEETGNYDAAHKCSPCQPTC
jgi:hypothetical protein